MAPNALDNTSRGQSEIQTPSTHTQSLDINHLTGGERNVQKLSATMSTMDNIGSSSMHLFPDLEIYHAPIDSTATTAPAAATDGRNSTSTTDATQTSNKPGADANPTATDGTQAQTKTDTAAPLGDQSWKSHINDRWVKDSLHDHPDWHAMEGLHPGEVAVGNWEPNQDERKVLGAAVDKMMAENNDGPVLVALPDGSVCTIEVVKGGHGGQSFSKGKDNSDVDGQKPRKVKFGRPASSDDDDSETSEDATEETSANPINQVEVA